MKRTSKQNNSLQLYARKYAKELNRRGISIQKALEETIELSWTEELFKKIVWVRIQEALTGKKSTTEPTTEEYILIQEHVTRYFGEKFGVYVPWPDRHSLAQERRT